MLFMHIIMMLFVFFIIDILITEKFKNSVSDLVSCRNTYFGQKIHFWFILDENHY